ncbi:helix-turn-helix domain-containing protein [Vagococcus carniphilus]|uniref:Helix-turn-helix domain-containing protein n=1 Tax=Vagococcus carniphilus TaxID=218144 RepID=A0AAW8U141_9ENTE|nr:helix-turn-helix domain-containing protein [Vagococcus carniphilus]MDT2813988.1 helix-turn-helix domain-containing protein [Vagococcus carniphilus]MDT2830450.1 helix-turn-helix domain-containing protein [Vagococcus carniphilus]MDT2832486.1 helix-turn-helix domain-containing protein [Vagococcus carniphilus]MDT2839981.1 helix-turn-helix domain-containing protein [Vagococcus carniphilus]MDT2848028.1 helix-turn-helix domain-containing protein [Vagococcus carniphilus]
MDTIIQIMKKYDFSEMETLVYTTLLEKGVMTGYEVSKQSGVARSKVYNVLEKLIKKNLVVVNKSEPKLYNAISSDEFLERLEKNVKNDLNTLESQLGKIKEQEEEELLWKLENYESVSNKMEHLIDNAKTSLLIQIWENDLSPNLLKKLQEAEKTVKNFVLILFSNEHHYDIPINNFYIHGFEEEKLQDFGARWVNVVADEKEVVFGTVENDNSSVDVTWTYNKAMVNLAKEYVKHDAYTLKIIKESPEELKQKYGNEFEKIRLIYRED